MQSTSKDITVDLVFSEVFSSLLFLYRVVFVQKVTAVHYDRSRYYIIRLIFIETKKTTSLHTDLRKCS